MGEHYKRIRLQSGRTVDRPAPEQMRQLRAAFNAVVKLLPAHPAAHGYVYGRSVLTALSPHVGCTYLCHLDLCSFFHSCKADAIYQRLKMLGMSTGEASDLCDLCCNTWGLPVGAPTSPNLSNLAAWSLDEELSHFTAYTRYSDQLILSGPMPPCERSLRECVRRHGFRVNEPKSFLRKRGSARMELMGFLIGETNIRRPRKYNRLERAKAHLLSFEQDGYSPTRDP